jgi:hypothetical protein
MIQIDLRKTIEGHRRDVNEESSNANTNVYAPIFPQQGRNRQEKAVTRSPHWKAPHPPTSTLTFQAVEQGTSSKMCLRVFVSAVVSSAGKEEAGWTMKM